jgi:hypothetical protein
VKWLIVPLSTALTLIVSLSSNSAAKTISSVTIPGHFQSEIENSGDWQTDCAVSNLTDHLNRDVREESYSIPTGSWQDKASIHGTWDENYRAGGMQNGASIPFSFSFLPEVFFSYNSAKNILDIIQFEPGPIHEPSSFLLLGDELAGFACDARQKNNPSFVSHNLTIKGAREKLVTLS